MLGTVLDSTDPAPGFELQDQHGQRVALSDYRGKVVVLTFLYTHCPDICPIVTSHLKTAYELLGDDADETAFVAVSVDPQRDTVERAYEYSDDWGMVDKWAFLVGDRERLEPIWSAYYIDPTSVQTGEDSAEPAQLPRPRPGSVGALHQDIALKYNAIHSAPVYLIDREGVMRVLFTLPTDPEEVVHDIRVLLD